MEQNQATSLPIFDSSALWNEKGTYSVLSEDGLTWRQSFLVTPDAARLERLATLANTCRPDKDGGETEKAFLEEHILWPRKVLFEPHPCVIWPLIPEAFRFGKDSSPDKALSAVRQGRLRKSVWFLSEKSRATMTPQERGNLSTLLRAMADLAHTVAFLHSKGFACCGLSDENVLLDLAHGKAFLTGVESFQTSAFPLSVPSAPIAYTAPEFVGASSPPDLQALRNADLHALAVLFYRLLLHRHPLVGAKRRDEALTYGSDALFIENPNDTSNRPDNLNGTIRNLGEPLERLFLDAFTNGLRDPRERPTAIYWENALETARQRYEERKRSQQNINIVKKASLPVPQPENVRNAKPVSPTGNPDSQAGEDASRTLAVHLEWEQTDGVDLDISAFLLRGREAGTASSDDMVFYGAPTHTSKSVRLLENVATDSPQKVQKIIKVEQNLIPPDVSKIDFVVTSYYADQSEYRFKAVKNAFLSVYDGSDNVLMRVDLRKDFGDCSACVAASLVRQNGQMTLTGPGRGHGGGLKAVCARYGIRVTG